MALVLALACSPSSTPAPVDDKVSAAVDSGARYLADRLDAIDPLHLSAIDYLHRNWMIEPLDQAGPMATESLASTEAGGSWDYTEYATFEQVLAMSRLVDPSRSIAPPPSDEPSTQVMTGGLYCDVRPLSDDDLAGWDEATRQGGYQATHVVLSWWFARSLGCTTSAVDEAGERAVAVVRAEFTNRVGASPGPEAVDDLSLEQAAFLTEVGVTDVVTPAWIDAVLDAQQPDGGWALSAPTPGATTPSHWHATLLAVWMLSASASDGNGEAWVRT